MHPCERSLPCPDASKRAAIWGQDALCDRRTFLAHSLSAAGALALGGCIRPRGTVDGLTVLDMQLGWLAGGDQLGEVAAKRLGFLEDEGIHLVIDPGGPHIDGVGIIASGRDRLGQVAWTGSDTILTSFRAECASGFPLPALSCHLRRSS